MLIITKLGTAQVSSTQKIIDGAPIAVENVYAAIPFLGAAGDTQIVSSSALQLISNQALTLANFANDVIINDISISSSLGTYVVGSQNGYPFFALVNSNGILQWSYLLSNTVMGSLTNICIDSNGNAYIIGFTSTNALVFKCNSSGVVQWQNTISFSATSENLTTINLTIDSSQNIYIIANAVAVSNDNPLSSAVIIAYNSSGVLLWKENFSISTSNVTGTGIALDSLGNLYITGISTSTTTMANGIDYYATIGFIAKYTASTGAFLTAYRFYTLSATQGLAGITDIKIDTSNNIYITAYGEDSNNEYVPFIIKLSSTFSVIWSTGIQTLTAFVAQITYPRLCYDSSENFYMTTIANQIYKFNSSGTFAWLEQFSGLSQITNIKIDTSNNIYITASSGTSLSAIDLSTNPVPGASSSYGSYVKFTPQTTALSSSAKDVYMTPITVVNISSTAVTINTLSGMTSSTSSVISNATTYVPKTEIVAVSMYNEIAENATGGLVWIKSADQDLYHYLFDTINNNSYQNLSLSTNSPSRLLSAGTVDEADQGGSSNEANMSFLRDGFYLNSNGAELGGTTGGRYASWIFSLKNNFFSISDYVGNGTTQQISHNLGMIPGFILIKSLISFNDWTMYHIANGGETATLISASGFSTSVNSFGNNVSQVNPTAQGFTIGSNTLINNAGETYVAYVFAHDPSLTGLVQCGSYTGNGSLSGPIVNLGWEPAYVLILPTTAGHNAPIMDCERGMTADGYGYAILMNNAEIDTSYCPFNQPKIARNATGFQIMANTGNSSQTLVNDMNAASTTYNYVAIRKGPMIYPQQGTQVFNAIYYTPTGATGAIVGFGFSPDLLISTLSSSSGLGSAFYDKLRGIDASFAPVLFSANTDTESSYASSNNLNMMLSDGFELSTNTVSWLNTSGQTYVYWGFKRSPGFFDEVCYQGTGATQTLNHNLYTTPQLIIIMDRTNSNNHIVWSNQFSSDYFVLNSNAIPTTDTGFTHFGNGSSAVMPSTTQFTVGTALSSSTTDKYVAYLFGSVSGVSLISTYIGNGSTLDINCNFPNTARFILIKNTTQAGDWLVWDVARGFNSVTTGGSSYSPHTALNQVSADVITDSSIALYSTGFGVIQNSSTNINVLNNTYLFFAIA